MTTIPTTALPGLIDWPRDEAAHDGCQWELWWVTTILQGGTRNLGAQAVITHLLNGSVVAMLTISDFDTDEERTVTAFAAPQSARLSRQVLDVSTDALRLHGSFEEGYRLDATLGDGDAFELTLRPTRPVLHNGAAGAFMLQGTRTIQYSIGGLDVSGSVRLDGEALEVSGVGWHDRQWEYEVRTRPPEFTWFGLCLDNGDTLSFFHPVGETSWVTIARPDGTHIVTAATAVPAAGRLTRAGRDVPAGWTLSIPARGARLDLAQRRVMDNERLYTGALAVSGTYDDAPASGFGFCDMAATVASAGA